MDNIENSAALDPRDIYDQRSCLFDPNPSREFLLQEPMLHMLGC